MKRGYCFPPFVFLVSLLLFHAAKAQHAIHVIPRVPSELLERPITLRSGIGTAHDAVTTKSADAQAFYDQGLAYLHSYVWIDAARSFAQALRLDPSLAMAHVGLSFAFVELNKPADARAAIDRAQALSPKVSVHERRHIEARALQVDAEAHAGEAARLTAYRQALDAAITQFPGDHELVLLRGIAESPDPADRGQGSVAAAIPHFERVLKASPNHFAAHHYLTHAYENSGRPDEALQHGAVYARTASAVPHARHMHGHNLRRAGRMTEAIAEFEAADGLHREYFTREGMSAEYDWHFAHNLDLLASSHRYLGQIKQAEALFKQSFSLPSNLVVQVYNKREWPSFLRSRGRLEEALAAAKQLTGHPHPLVQAAAHIEAGYTLVAVGRWGEAANESNTALRILRGGPEGAPMAGPALLGLQGEIALRTADREKGRRVLLDAVSRFRAMPGAETWATALFAMESMARTARQVGDWPLAGQLAQQMLAQDAAYGGTHYALALVAEHEGDVKTARAAFAAAQKAWTKADASLAELVEIRKRLK